MAFQERSSSLRSVGPVALAVSLLAASPVLAQPSESPVVPDVTAEPTSPAASNTENPAQQPAAATASAPTLTVEDRLRVLEQKDVDKLKRIEELESTVATLNEQLAVADAESSEDRRLSAWGFFDVTFGRTIYDNSSALYAIGTPRYWSFMTNGINVYLKSEMTKTLSAMVETRLTYTPTGTVLSNSNNIYMNGQLVQTQGTFVREQVLHRNPYSYFQYHQHGLFIERAHLDWKPLNWLALRVGRYLTPFGIWNEDHGSPVVLGIDMPNVLNYAVVPTHQFGIQLYGNRLLSDSLNLEYALTLSNGRGPIDEYKDLDNNKAIGLRGKLVYSSDDLMLRVGGYGYYGRYTDRTEPFEIYLTPTFGIDRSQAVPFGSTAKATESYYETIGTLEAMIQFKGLKVIGELAHRRVMYDTAPLMNQFGALLNNVPYGLQIHAASYTGIAYYGLAGYEFDLGESLGNTKLTPYAGADHLSPDQTMPFLDMNQYRVGLNVKPSPYVTNKLEVMRVIPRATEMASKLWQVAVQAAVSF